MRLWRLLGATGIPEFICEEASWVFARPLPQPPGACVSAEPASRDVDAPDQLERKKGCKFRSRNTRKLPNEQLMHSVLQPCR